MIGKKKKAAAIAATPPVEPMVFDTPTPVVEAPVVPVVPEVPVAPVAQPVEVQPEQRIVQVPVSLSQSQINNLVIENNMMLKEILEIAQEE